MGTPVFEFWTSRLSCGCWTAPVSPDGHRYGRLREGSYISCTDDLRHQGAYRVLETKPTTAAGGGDFVPAGAP